MTLVLLFKIICIKRQKKGKGIEEKSMPKISKHIRFTSLTTLKQV